MTKAESFAMQYGFYDKEKKHACCVGYNAGYKQAEKDMKERFIQFVHSHYPINYIGWIQDFQKAMEDEQ